MLFWYSIRPASCVRTYQGYSLYRNAGGTGPPSFLVDVYIRISWDHFIRLDWWTLLKSGQLIEAFPPLDRWTSLISDGQLIVAFPPLDRWTHFVSGGRYRCVSLPPPHEQCHEEVSDTEEKHNEAKDGQAQSGKKSHINATSAPTCSTATLHPCGCGSTKRCRRCPRPLPNLYAVFRRLGYTGPGWIIVAVVGIPEHVEHREPRVVVGALMAILGYAQFGFAHRHRRYVQHRPRSPHTGFFYPPMTKTGENRR